MSSDASSDTRPGSAEIQGPKDEENKTGSETTTPAPLEPRLDIATLKSEILTSGMEAAANGDAETLQELVLKFEYLSIPRGALINIRNSHGYNMLHYAVMYKRINCIETLLRLGADINYPTTHESRDSPLILSMKYLNSFPPSSGEEDEGTVVEEEDGMKVIELLVARGCKVNASRKAHESPIMLAIGMNNLQLIKELMAKSELNVNITGKKGKTPLHMVAADDNHQIAEALLQHGADVHIKDTGGYTALHAACYSGSINIVELIFKERAEETTTLLTEKDRHGNTPLMIAKKSPHSNAAVVKLLIEHDVDVQYTNEMSETLLHMFGPMDNAESNLAITAKDPSLLSHRNFYRQTPLHTAAMMGHKESLLVFVQNGADINARDYDEMTPLMLAIRAGNVETISVMLDMGCDIHSDAKTDKSVLVWAIGKEYTALLKALIRKGPDSACQKIDHMENTVMHAAAKSGAVKCIQVLLDDPVTEGLVHSENVQGHTPLHIGAQYGNLKCIKELLDGDAVITKVDKELNNSLHIACIYGQLDVVQFLLHSGLSAELSNEKLGTPISCAAFYGRDKIVKFLLDRDVSCNGNYTELKVSPLLLATQQGHLKVIKVLLDYPRIDVTLTNKIGHNALAEAIIKGHKDIALEIITSVHWDKAMRMCTSKNMTPMRLLITHMPDLARVVLDKCIVTKEVEVDGAPFATHLFYNYEFVDDFDDPKLGVIGKCIVESVLPSKSKRQENSIPFVRFDTEDATAVVESPSNINNWGPNMYDKRNHTMALMVESENMELLQHPLVSELLNHKWYCIAFPLFLIQFVMYLLFLLLLTFYILWLPNPRGDTCAREDFAGDCVDSSDDRRRFLSVATVLLVILSCFSLVLEGLQAFSRRLEYFTDTRSYVDISIAVLTISFVISVRTNDCFCSSGREWQVGCVVIFLAWVAFILLMRGFPFTAIPINMLLSIIRSFFKVFALPILLIVAFGLPLFLLFHIPGEDDAYGSVPITFLKSAMLTTGELDFNDTFIERDVFYPYLYFFWIVFVIVMPIVFNNLLVGLAVGDTNEELEKATYNTLALQIRTSLDFEQRLPSARFYFSEDVHVIARNNNSNCVMSIVDYVLEFLLSNSFDGKVKALQDSNEKSENLIEEYQKRNPTEEVKEKLTEQDSELSVLKEFAASGLKQIEMLSTQLEKLSNIVKRCVPEDALKNAEDKNGTGDNKAVSAPPMPLPDYF